MNQRRCPDAGVCHHECEVGCWRVSNTGPLSGVYPNNEWPDSIITLDGAEEVWWCKVHRNWATRQDTWCRYARRLDEPVADCDISLRYMISLPDKETTDFYEEDEPIEDVKAAWEQGEKGMTGIHIDETKGNIIKGNTFLPSDKENTDEKG